MTTGVSQGVAGVLPARARPPRRCAAASRAPHVPLRRLSQLSVRLAAARRAGASSAGSGDGEAAPSGAEAHWDDANWLQTALNEAVASEEYAQAAKLRNRLRALVGEWAGPADWFGLGLPTWLAERTERLGFRMPTEVQRRVLPPANAGLDVVLRSGTGSGKTLAFLLPALSNLDFVQRALPQVLLVVPSRDLGVQHVMLAWRLLGGNISRRMPGDAANMFSYRGPQGVRVRGLFDARDVERAATKGYLEGVTLVVGTPEALGRAITLGALPLQCVDQLLVDEADACLPGGVPQQQPPLQEPPPASAAAAADAEAVAARVVLEAEVMAEEEEIENLRSGNAKEEEEEEEGPPPPALQPQEAAALWAAPARAPKRWHTVLAGATVPEACLDAARAAGLIPDPVYVQLGEPAALPAALRHRLVLVAPPPPGGPPPTRRILAALCRLIRQDVAACGGPDAAPARGIVFAPDEAVAVDAAEPLRAALWGSHTLAVLLPGGAEPTRAAHAFRDGAASLLLATPSAERGLDMPAVRFVYNMAPPESATAYLHRAGRAGRIGATVRATVTTLCLPEDAPRVRALAAELGFTLEEEDEPLPSAGGVDGAADEAAVAAATVQSLEDLFNLYP